MKNQVSIDFSAHQKSEASIEINVFIPCVNNLIEVVILGVGEGGLPCAAATQRYKS